MVLPYDNMDYGEDQIGARNISELTDVELTNLANGEVLKYNSTSEKWENQTTIGTESINTLTDTNITTPITNGSSLIYNTTSGKWENNLLVDLDTLNNLSDTNISSVANKDFLLYDSTSSKWINTPSNIENLKNVSLLLTADKEILQYNAANGNWENNILNLNTIQDVNITSLQNGEVLRYNSTSSKWENQNNTDTLNELTDVTLTGSSNNQVLKYNGSIWVNNFVNLTELADTNIPALNNGDILRYNSISQKWETDTFNIDDLDNVNITGVANNEVLKYNSTSGKWENSNRIDTLDELGDVTLTSVTSGDLLRYNGSIFVNTKIALDNDFTNVNFTSLTNGDLIKYDGSNFINFAPTYLDGAGITDNYLIKVVGGVTTQTNMIETSVLNTSTSLKTFIPGSVLSILAGSIETEIFDTTKQRMHLTTRGIAYTNGITITSDGRVGIGVVNPEEDLELDGNIQLDTGGAQRGRVIFYDKQNDHEHAEVDGLGEGTNGGSLAFYTKVDNGSVTEKLRINNKGAIGIGGSNFGNTGQVIVSNGSGSSVSWADQTDTTYTGGTGVTINGSNQINIGQPVATTNSVTFAGLDVTETTILRGQTTIDNVLFDQRTDSVISGTTYNIHSSIDNTKNLLLGYHDTTNLKKYWKTISNYARERIDLVAYNESVGVPTSATFIQIKNTGTAANDIIKYVAQGNHNFYDNDSSKNGIINTARINIKDYAVDNTEYCSIRTSKTGNGGDLEFYVKDNNGSLEKRMNMKKEETEITNNTGKLILSSDTYGATTGPRIKFSMLDPNVPADDQSVRIRHNIFDGSSPSGSGTPFGLIIEKDGSNTQSGDAYLEVEGRIYSGGIIGHHGVSLNETTVTTSTTQITSHDIDKVIVVDGAVNFSSGWVTFLSYNNFAVGGSYIIHIYSNDSNNSPAHYYYNYTGVMSWTSFPNTNDANSSQEIPLHGYGRAVEGVGPSIKLRTLSRSGSLTPELQIADATGVNADAIFNFTFKMRRML